VLDPQQRTFTFAHLDPTLYCPLGSMQAAGGSYAWLERVWRRDREDDTRYEQMDRAAATVPAGSRGLLFLPHLLGERSPYWNPLARGAFVGLAMPHGRAEMARAVLEGVAYNLRLICDAYREQGVTIETLRLIGGGARSPLWRQIIADVVGVPILLPRMTAEATALGAAIAGGVGVGLFSSYRAAADLVPAQLAAEPNTANAERYRSLCRLYRRSYAALEPIFEALAPLAE
jgi:xylulokinase